MPDLDDLALDRAFTSLTRDLAHSPGPGAAAAIRTSRNRRRTRVGAVALATALVVGGGTTLPRLVFPEGGVAADGGSARFDTAALTQAGASEHDRASIFRANFDRIFPQRSSSGGA